MSNQSKVNLLNLAKEPGLFRAFVAPPGHLLLYLDFNSLEPHVSAQLSKDPNMMKLYRKGQPKNDPYLFTGAQMSLFRDEIRKHYDPDNPTPETLKAAKEACVTTRAMLKKFYLSVGYGAFPNRIKEEMNLVGHNITMRDATMMHRDYWETYSGIKRFEAALKRQYALNGGWIYNGRGIPHGVDPKLLKDLVNRVVQSTGHMILMRYILFINQLRHERQVPMRPYIVDYHDATIWQVKTEAIKEAKQVYKDALKTLNDELQWDVEITGDIKTGQTLAAFLD